jgi:glycosyltransferase involved in cell wall biosynthesis
MAHTDAHLVLAGARGDDSDTIDAGLSGHPALDRIRRLGPIDDTTKTWLLRHAAALAYPSVDEGFGFPILEAQRYGVPVVATDVGSVGEVAGNAAVLVTGREPAAFAAALARAMTGAERIDLIEAGCRNVDRFRWETTATELLDLYRRACDA